MRPKVIVSLTRSGAMRHVPLAALGYALRQGGVLEGLHEIDVPAKSIEHSNGEKLIEALALILAGGRSTQQANLLLRPNRGWARAWGQAEFAEQSTLARTLEVMDEQSVVQLRQTFDALFTQWSHTAHHDFRRGDLWLDDDLSGLRASRRAEGSERGYFSGEKTQGVVRWHACAASPTTRPFIPDCMPARRIA